MSVSTYFDVAQVHYDIDSTKFLRASERVFHVTTIVFALGHRRGCLVNEANVGMRLHIIAYSYDKTSLYTRRVSIRSF